MNKAKILVVDDTPANLNILYRVLNQADFDVRVAADGQSALAMVESDAPDLVLLDIMMPGLDGFEVCRRLKANPAGSHIPVIFMTSLNSTADKVRGLNLGAQDYITKPFQQVEVLARIRTHLELYRLQTELRARNEALEQEISVRKRVEASLERTAGQLQAHTQALRQRNAELDAFAHTVAHDLKNPVSSVIGLARLVPKQLGQAEFPNHDKVRRNIDLIGQAGQQAFNIIDALLTLARTAREDVELRPLAMGDIVAKVLQRLDDKLDESGARVELPKTWPAALGHAAWVEEIWFNYLHNGLKYGGTPPCLALSSAPADGGGVRFEVRDNGPGLDAEARRKLFQPFVRLHQERAEGHGLGLTIVRQISEKLGGRAGVDSTPGQGSRFYFILPGPPFAER